MNSKIVSLFVCMLTISLTQNAFAQSSSCDPAAIKVATTPIPTQVPASLVATEKLIGSKVDSANIVLIGDSILAGWWETAQADFESQRYWNFSVGWDKTQYVLWRMGKANLSALNPKAVVVLIGTNNLADVGMSGCAIFAGVKAVLESVQSAWPNAQIFPIGILPRGADFRDWQESRDIVNQSLSTLKSATVHPVFVDENTMSCGQFSKPTLPRKDILSREKYYKCENYIDDNLHLKADGYRVLRQALKEESVRVFGSDILAQAVKLP